MITFEQALETMVTAAVRKGEESVPLVDCLDRVLARDVKTDRDMPPADTSAMDGYACRQDDRDKPMRVVETIAAGRVPTLPVEAGECARIMTGAILPQGADTVVMFEHAEEKDGWVRVTRQSDSRNVRWKGEDGHAGDTVLRAGTVISPGVIALLASAGCDPAPVFARPVVAVMATGDELVEPRAKPDAGKIRNSNGYQLCAQLRKMGVVGRYEGIVRDELEELVTRIGQVRKQADLVLMSGGVSEGDYDLVPEAFRRCGYRLLFESVAMQPGRPMVFGADGKSFCCGLPGNPVSTFVVLEILLKPFLYAMMGRQESPRMVPAMLAQAFRRRKADRQSTIPVRFQEPGWVAPVEYHGSAHILAISQADALLTIPVGVSEIKEGTTVYVRPL